MKVIFLDIDGVLATNKEYMVNRTKFQTKHAEAKELRIPYPYNPQCVKIFNEIIEATDATIVLSSDWRFHWDLDEIDRIFKFNGLNKSPEYYTINRKRKMSSSLGDDRHWQIMEWVNHNKPDTWVAIDDLNLTRSFEEGGCGQNFFLTNDSEGIKKIGLKNKIIKHLNADITSKNPSF